MADSRTEYQRQWYLKNREKKLEQSRARYSANREVRLEQNKEYRKLHPEVGQRATIKYRTSHSDICRQRCRDWYARNIETERRRGSEKSKVYYAQHKQRLLSENREWRKNNKAAAKAIWMKRRALLNGARINLSKIRDWIKLVKSKPIIRCYYCDKLVSTSRIHFDHIVPLSKGGVHSVDNLCVACSSCNLSKKAKTVSAWIRIGQQVLSL